MRRSTRWRHGSIFVLAIALLVVMPALAWAGRPHIVWVVVDSLRFDHVDVYVPSAKLTPALLARAQRATVFWRAYAPSSWTVPSVASLLTAQYPSVHAATRFGAAPVFDETSAAPALARAGYRTVAVSANAFLSRSSSFATGFHDFIDLKDLLGPDRKGKARGEEVVRALDRWLSEHHKANSPPLFVYLHFMDPHWPYGPKEEFYSQVLPRYGDPDTLRKIAGELYFGQLRLDGNVPPDVRIAVRALYAGEVLATDHVLAELFATLERHGLSENMLLVLTADHGEELFDHEHIGHGRTLYEELIHIPLLIWFPGQRQRVDVHTPVSSIDLLPTALAVAGLSHKRTTFPFGAISLAGCGPATSWTARMRRLLGWSRCADPHRPVFAELLPLRPGTGSSPVHRGAVIRGDEKLLVSHEGTARGVDLAKSPREDNGAALPQEKLQELEQLWTAFQSQLSHPPRAVPIITPDAATREQLRALGYGD